MGKIENRVESNKKRQGGEQGWGSGESVRLPPMGPRFKSRRRRQIWVEFVVGSLFCFERFFFLGLQFSPLLKNQPFQIPVRPGIRQTRNHFVDVLPPNHYYLLLTHRATTTFLWKSPLELFMNRKPRIRLSGLRVKSSIEDVFKDNLDLTTKQRLSNPRKLVLGFWTSKSRPLSGIDIKNNYVHGSYLHLCAESYVASPVSKPSGSFSPRK